MTGIPTTCPSCKKRISYGIREVAQPDGGIVVQMIPCPHCGFSVDIATLTARGVQLREEITGLRRKPHLSGVDVRRLDQLQKQYDGEYKALEITWPS